MSDPEPTAGNSREELVTVASFRDLSEALIAKGQLDAAGISCFLADDNIVRMDWFWSNLMSGVKLNVPASQVDIAVALLSGEGESQRVNLSPRFARSAAQPKLELLILTRASGSEHCGFSDFRLHEFRRFNGDAENAE